LKEVTDKLWGNFKIVKPNNSKIISWIEEKENP